MKWNLEMKMWQCFSTTAASYVSELHTDYNDNVSVWCCTVYLFTGYAKVKKKNTQTIY